MGIITTNKKAYHDFAVVKTFEAGIVLEGSEVKSIRAGETNLKDSFVVIDKRGEVWLKNMYIKPYEKSSAFVPDSRKSRKLLLHNSEIAKLKSKVQEKGFAIVPLKMYFSGKNVKLEIALAEGKHTYDKRRDLMENDKQRDLDRQLKNYSRYN